MDSSEGSEKSLEERSLLDRTARPGTPLQRRLQREEGDRPDQEEEEGQQLYTMGDRDIEGEDNVATLRQEVLKARRERDSKVLYRGQAPSLDEADSYEIWVRKWLEGQKCEPIITCISDQFVFAAKSLSFPLSLCT